MPEKKVCIGRIVRYISLQAKDEGGNPQEQAAIVTKVGEGEKVSLGIFYPMGYFTKPEVPYSETPKPGHWHWPPTV